jgi:hypothetical protein
MVLATLVIPIAGAFVFWNISWFGDKAITVLLTIFRIELVIAALISIAIAFDPYVIASAEEHQKAKDALKYKRKML